MMRWKSPSSKTQDILFAPIGITLAVIAVPVVLVALAVNWPISRYLKWSQSRGWHRWFAWRPVYCGDFWCVEMPRKWVWLETVYRHTWEHGSTEYRWPEQVPSPRGSIQKGYTE